MLTIIHILKLNVTVAPRFFFLISKADIRAVLMGFKGVSGHF